MVVDRVKGNSLLVSMFVSESIICSMIVKIIPIPNISVVLMMLIGIASIYLNRRFSARAFLKIAIPWALIVLLLIVSGFVNGFKYVSNYMVYFIVFGTVGAMISVNDVDINCICKDIVAIYTVYLVVYFVVIRHQFLNSGDAYYADSMGIAYAMTTIIYIAIVYCFYSDAIVLNKRNKLFLYVDSLIALVIIVIDCRSRGPILAIIIALIVVLLIRTRGLKKMALIFFGGIASIAIVDNFLSIVVSIYGFFKQYNIEFSALGKIIYLNSSQLGLSNGRNQLYELAVEKSKESIIIGHGVGYYETLGMGYVHNLVLDILLSIGVIGLTVIGLFFIYYLHRVLVFCNKKTQAYMLLLIFIGVIMLLFSSSLWLYPPFWAFFFGMINIRQNNDKNLIRS